MVLSFKVSSYRYLKIVLKALACHGLKLRTALHLMGRQFCALWQSCSITSYPSCEYLMGGKLKTFLAAIVNYARVWKDCYVLRYCMQKKLSIYLAQKKSDPNLSIYVPLHNVYRHDTKLCLHEEFSNHSFGYKTSKP